MRAIASLTILFLTGAAAAQEQRDASLLTLLAAGDFTRVDAVTDQWRDQYELGKIGGDEYLRKLEGILPAKGVAKSTEVDLRNWVSTFPKSYAANFVLGEFYNRLAFQLRGGKYRSETTQQQFSDFAQYEAQARDQLLASTTLTVKPYASYVELIDAAVALRDEKGTNGYFIAGTRADPQAMKIWQKFLNYHTPKWLGSVAQMDKIMELALRSPLPAREKEHLAAINWTLQAEDAVAREKYAAAVALYQKAYDASPGKETVWRLNEAAIAAQKGGNSNQAIDFYGKSLAVDPDNVVALNKRGWLLENERKDFALAFNDYMAAAKLDSAWAQTRAGQFLMTGKGTSRDFESAQQLLEQAAAKHQEGAEQSLRELAALRRH